MERTQEGKVVFLERGNLDAGLAHIERHAAEFAARGISEAQIPDAVMAAVTRGRIIGRQGTRSVYEFDLKGKKQYLSITVGDNGFIVGANPTKTKIIERLLGKGN